jgi:hypothetical protein
MFPLHFMTLRFQVLVFIYHIVPRVPVQGVKVKKVKFILVEAMRLCTGRTAHRVSRGIALLFHDHGTKRG